MKNGQFPAVIQLADLNGENGFKLDGQYINDWTGYNVDTAGDINGDGYDDIIIGAFGYPQGTGSGCSYVVFGRKNLGEKASIIFQILVGLMDLKS